MRSRRVWGCAAYANGSEEFLLRRENPNLYEVEKQVSERREIEKVAECAAEAEAFSQSTRSRRRLGRLIETLPSESPSVVRFWGSTAERANQRWWRMVTVCCRLVVSVLAAP